MNATALSVARRVAFWLGAVELVIGVLVLCFMFWMTLVVGGLGEPGAIGLLVLVAGGVALVGFVTKYAADSDRPAVVGAGLAVLVVIPLAVLVAT